MAGISLSVVALWFGLERLDRLDRIRRTADLSEELENARDKGGAEYVVRSAVSSRLGISLIVLESMETGEQFVKRIAGVSDRVDVGWRIAVDPDGRYMAGMPPMKTQRLSKNETI